jgi:iron(II)-dependent oxidoreductase
MNEPYRGYSKAHALRSGGKAPVREALLDARRRTLAWADAYERALRPSAMRVPYAPDFNPPLWELGHLAWFQACWIERNRQRPLGVNCDPEHERAASRLPQADSWYDSGRIAHRARWDLPLPGLDATRAYLASTLDRTLELLEALPQDAGPQALYFFRLVALHEAMHAEAAAYMARLLGFPLEAPASAGSRVNSALEQLRLPAQSFRLGEAGEAFAFDNELAAHDVALASFEIDARPVSWARFAGFVEAAGYRQRRWWSDAGWEWLQQQEAARGEIPRQAQPHAPAVHLSAHEAEAWCRWAGRRLPTEAQWECAALTSPDFAWGSVWEWSACAFEPYPGFSAHPYRDYSQPWFGSRRVLRGACAATSPWLAHPRYRNFFEPHRSDIFAGFRSCA